jgi:hypothetical protein
MLNDVAENTGLAITSTARSASHPQDYDLGKSLRMPVLRVEDDPVVN